MRIIKILAFIIFLIGLILFTLSVILNSANLTPAIKIIESKSQEYIGRKVSIEHIRLDLTINNGPGILIDGITLENPKGSKQKNMATIKRAVAHLAFMPLLSGNLVINDLTIDGADISLEENAKGKGNWEFDIPESKEPAKSSKAEQTPATASAESESDFKLPLNNVTIRNTTINYQPYQEKPINLKIKSLYTKTNGNIHNIRLVSYYNDTPLFVKSKIDLPNLKNISANSETTFGRNIIRSQINYKQATPKPKITANIDTNNLDIDLMLKQLGLESTDKPSEPAKTANTSKNKKQRDAKVIPNVEIPKFDIPVDVFLKLNAKRIKYDNNYFSNVALSADAQNNMINLSSLKAKTFGGEAEITATMDMRQTPTAYKTSVSFENINAQRMFEAFDIDQNLKKGSLTFKTNIHGQGNDLYSLFDTMDGNVTVYLADANYLLDKNAHLSNALITLFTGGKKDKAIPIQCIIASYDVKDGIATSKATVFDTKAAFVLGKGNVNLDKETVNLVLTPSGRGFNLSNFLTPVNITGPFNDVSISINKRSLIWTIGKSIVATATGYGLIIAGASAVYDGVSNAGKSPCADTLKKLKKLEAEGG